MRRNCQGAAKACNHARSVITQKVNGQNAVIFKHIKCLLVEISGQLRILGLSKKGDVSSGVMFCHEPRRRLEKLIPA